MRLYKTAKDYYEAVDSVINSNLVGMSRFYHDVDIFYKLIHPGTRLKDDVLLITSCLKMLKHYENIDKIDTPDYGGLLCVLGYNYAKIKYDKKEQNIWLDKCNNYFNTCKLKFKFSNPHNVRWHISLYYVMGIVTHDTIYYKLCSCIDYRQFNCTILTKQIDACIKVARSLIASDVNKSLQWYTKAIKLGESCLHQPHDKTIGNNNFWYETGFKELSDVMHLAYVATSEYNKILGRT